MRTVRLLSPPGIVPDPFWVSFFELMVRSRFRTELSPPSLGDAEIASLAAPTQLLLGHFEATFNPYRALERGVRLLPNLISAEIVPGVGHSMVHNEPGWVADRVIRFLERYAA